MRTSHLSTLESASIARAAKAFPSGLGFVPTIDESDRHRPFELDSHGTERSPGRLVPA